MPVPVMRPSKHRSICRGMWERRIYTLFEKMVGRPESKKDFWGVWMDGAGVDSVNAFVRHL